MGGEGLWGGRAAGLGLDAEASEGVGAAAGVGVGSCAGGGMDSSTESERVVLSVA